jgi:hypothetical protein
MRSALLAVAFIAYLLHACASPALGVPATPARLPFTIGLGGARNVGMSVSSIVASDRARVEHIRADARARQPLSSAAADPVVRAGKFISRSVHSINATNSIVRALESAYTRRNRRMVRFLGHIRSQRHGGRRLSRPFGRYRIKLYVDCTQTPLRWT